ncbi:hypothetical protein E8E11_005575 [Didymella keratinophila]|nr:hypothetical protein E8E11_005575 [Didymella keratinophila]
MLDITHNFLGSAVSGEILDASVTLRAPSIDLKTALTGWFEPDIEKFVLIPDLPWCTDTEKGRRLRLTGFFEDFDRGLVGDRVCGLSLIFCNNESSIEYGSPSCEQHLLVVAESNESRGCERLGVAQITLALPDKFDDWMADSSYKSADAEALLLRYLESLPIQEITLV